MTKGESFCGQKQPKYYQLMTDLKEKVTKGEIRPGDKLPSENELSAAYQISRQTVRKALAVLDSEGYIYAEHGRGTFCRERVMHGKFQKYCCCHYLSVGLYFSSGHSGDR